MATPNFEINVNVPFAQNGARTAIPTTTADGSVSMENGYGEKYNIPPSEGGFFITREQFNALFYLATAGIKELQEVLKDGNFTVVEANTINSVLSLDKGGTGATSAVQALANLGGLATTGGTITGNLAVNGTLTNAGLQNQLNQKLNLSGGVINGTLTVQNGSLYAPTPAATSNDTRVATTAFTQNLIASKQGKVLMPDWNTYVSKTGAEETFNDYDYGFLYASQTVSDSVTLKVLINGFEMNTGYNGTGSVGTPSGLVFIPIKRGDTIRVFTANRSGNTLNNVWTAIKGVFV